MYNLFYNQYFMTLMLVFLILFEGFNFSYYKPKLLNNKFIKIMLYSIIIFISIYDLSLSLISLIVLISLDSYNTEPQQIVELPNKKTIIPDEDIANTILYNELDKMKPNNDIDITSNDIDIINNDIDITNNDIENTEININTDELNFADVINSNEIDNIVINNKKDNEVVSVPSPNDHKNLYSHTPEVKKKKKKSIVPKKKEQNVTEIKKEQNVTETKDKNLIPEEHKHTEHKSDCSSMESNLMGHVSDENNNDDSLYSINTNSKILAHNEDNYFYNI